MAVVINDDYSLAGSGSIALSTFNPTWVKQGTGSYNLVTTSVTPRRIRLSGPSPGGSAEYRSTAQGGFLDMEATAVVRWLTVTPPAADFRMQIRASSSGAGSAYYLASSKTGGTVYKLDNGAFTTIGTLTAPVVGTTYTFVFRVEGNHVTLTRNGVSIVDYIDPSPLTTNDYVMVTIQDVESSGAPSDSTGVHLFSYKLETFGSTPQDLNPNAVYSESYAVTPTLTTTGFLSPAAVYSESYAVTPTLVPVTYPLDVTPIFSRSYAVTPTLSGGPAVLEITPVYSESYIVTPFLATGQVIEPQPVYSEAYAVTPELIPGPVEIELTPVYSLSYTVLPSLAMSLTLNPNAVYSESYTRKPTLKSRFPCCGLDSLQDRAGARTAQDGGSSCNIGVRGSDGFVKW